MIQKLTHDRLTTETHSATRSSLPTDPSSNSWNSLWNRSGDAIAFGRWQSLQQVFGREANEVQLLQVRRRRAATLGLALVAAYRKRVRYYRSANSDWFQAGSLLSDKQKATTGCFEKLADQIRQLPGSFVYLDWMADSVEFHRLIDALRLNGCYVYVQPQFRTGLIRLKEDCFDEYFAGRSKSFRKKIRGSMRKLQQLGQVQHACHRRFELNEQQQVVSVSCGRTLNELLQSACDVEDLGWKSQAGSTFNRNTQARETLFALAREAALAGLLELHFLTVDNRLVAFDLGFVTDETYFSYKISYDPKFASFSPGQLLTYLQMQHWFAKRQIKLVNTVGEISQATGKWSNDHLDRYRVVISTGGLPSNLGLRGFSVGKAVVKKLLRR